MIKKYNKGFICGFFDILHDGHVDILKQARLQCQYLIVAVGTDEFMHTRKARESILSYKQRTDIVRAIRYVDQVVPETDLDKVAAYHKYHFDVMFAGDDHLNEKIYIEATRHLKELGVDTIYIHRQIKTSSTEIRKRVIELSRLKQMGDTNKSYVGGYESNAYNFKESALDESDYTIPGQRPY